MALPELDEEVTLDGVTRTLRELVIHHARTLPSDARVREAAVILLRGGQHNLVPGAMWLELADQLGGAGWTEGRIAGLAVACFVDRTRTLQAPPPGVAAALIARAAEVERASIREALEVLPSTPQRDVMVLTCAIHEPRVSAAALWALTDPLANAQLDAVLGVDVLRALYARLEPEQRAELFLRTCSIEPLHARNSQEVLRFVFDLVPLTDAVVERAMALRALLTPREDLAARRAWLEAREVMLPGDDGLTAAIRPSLRVTLEHLDDERLAERLGPVAEAACARRIEVAGAPELGSLEAWRAASDARRAEITAAVCAALCAEVGKASAFRVDGATIAPAKGKLRLALVPGGRFRRGLSEREEARLRELAEARRGQPNHFEEHVALLEAVGTMRPVVEVEVPPLLIGQAPGDHRAPAALVRWLEKGPYRLPTEAEWEYCARGGRDGELTARGDDPPDAAALVAMKKLKARGANDLGVWGVGLLPEVCADLHAPSYDDAPTDGSPRRGAGPRVVRGGAAHVFPWQQVGEWQLLLSAVRSSQREWETDLFCRPVIGLRLR
ncbi:MAG: SUMF1/EgtB/PvdO family nonheme iron enzyme [Sandaracinaceae bacterium]|nr:SUMF1/EgtB/PvdO family nonheme iron enzyme [Sandaracinaceae bacterium]